MLPTDMDVTDFVELYDRTLDDVYRYASRLTGGDRVRADELVQETYLAVLRRLGADGQTFEPTVAYLVVACRSRFIDQLRSERRRRRRELRVATEHGPPSATEPTDPDHGAAIAALGRLPDDQRVALILRYVDDLTVADVADQLGRSVRATESLLVRGRRTLRAVYQEGSNP